MSWARRRRDDEIYRFTTSERRQAGGHVEEDPDSWYAAVYRISKAWFQSGVKPKDIELVTFSGHMQNCIPIGADGKPLRPAILYSDGRGGEQARRLRQQLGDEAIHSCATL